ncbi:hypothetical protein [Candidatus Palauibacter sp.]|uniref:hypothetical protein n=1 Tax=Candidatus Palauibacter sp. TaxID=3101350 RepID=UPI003B5C9668
MQAEMQQVKRTIRWLQGYAVLASIALVVLFVRNGSAEEDVLRARGLIIEDAAGRERILLGAPIPEAVNRVRTDTARLRELWGAQHPDIEAYMDSYEEYNHGTNGLVILNEDGFDRLVLGEETPDPHVGKRIAPSSGLVVHDRIGFERGGFGVLSREDSDYVALGLDSSRGEAISLIAFDAGMIGAYLNDGGDFMFLGKGPEGSMPYHDEPFLGLTFWRDGEVIHDLNVDEGN